MGDIPIYPENEIALAFAHRVGEVLKRPHRPCAPGQGLLIDSGVKL
jgi:hypothetical protein